ATSTRRIQAADQIHQRGFAGARRTHNCDIFTLVDFEVDPLKGVYQFRAHLVGLGETFGANGNPGIHEVLSVRLRRCRFSGHVFSLLSLYCDSSVFFGAELSTLMLASGLSVRNAL